MRGRCMPRVESGTRSTWFFNDPHDVTIVTFVAGFPSTQHPALSTQNAFSLRHAVTIVTALHV